MEFARISPENAAAFHTMIREEAYPFLMDSNVIGIGLVDDHREAAGAVVARVDDEGVAELMSVCVAKAYRRKGYGTELLVELADVLVYDDRAWRFKCDFAEKKGSDGFRKFLKSLGFNISKNEEICYMTSTKKMAKIPELQNRKPRCIAYKDMTEIQKKQLYGRGMDLKPLMDKGLVDGNISCVKLRNGRVSGCLIFVRVYENKALMIQWAENSREYPLDALRMFSFAAEVAGRFRKDLPVYVPALNTRSAKLADRLLKKYSEVVEQGYSAYLNLSEDDTEE